VGEIQCPERRLTRPDFWCDNKLIMKLTAAFLKVPEGYVAFIEELPGANTQGATLDEARENLHEAVALVLEANREMAEQSLEGAPVLREAFVLPAA
jgi:predicted RNase H-like HicB family nuclease